MQITGAGDMVLTDIKETSAGLVIDEGISGRLSIRDRSDYLVAEITKTPGRSMELGLEPGLYRITLQQGNAYSRAEVTLSQDSRTTLFPTNFSAVAAPASTARGEGEGEPEDIIPVGIQFVPGMGTSGFDRRATNYVLFGILGAAGYNLRGFGLSAIGLINTGYVRGVQVSGIFNIAVGGMDGMQLGAIFNMTQRDVRGIQLGGIFNYAGGNRDGIQLGGILNLTRRDARGIQIGGISNYSGGGMDGMQLGGIFNLTQRNVRGVQAGGIAFNYAGGDRDGMQLGGILNLTRRNARGVQIGGISNYSGGNMDGVQIAPIANLASGGFRGLQLGIINYNGERSDGGEDGGVKIGLVNISRSENVVPIGLVNIVKNGILHPTVWYDDMRFLNLGLRSGSKYLYSILSAGIRDMGFDSSLLISRAGLGGEIPLGRFFINMDFTAGNLINWKNIDDSENILLQARLSGGFKVFEHLGIFGGVSYDCFLTFNDTSRDRITGLGIPALRWENDRTIHKIGLFGGIQF
jgi:hypothetical protein